MSYLLRVCPWSNELYVHIFLTCAPKRESRESSMRATSMMYKCLSLVYSIRPSACWLMWYRQTVWEAYWVFALGTVYCDYWTWDNLHWQCVSREWGPYDPTEHVMSLDWYVSPDFWLPLPRCCAQFVETNVRSRTVQWPVSFHFLRFDLTGDCPSVRLSIQARTAQSHMEWSATPSCGRAAFGLAKDSSAWVFRGLVCDDIFSSCALMCFFTVRHQVCDCDLSTSSTQLKPISWPRPPGYKVSSSSLSLCAPSAASPSASSLAWSRSPEWPRTFTKWVRQDDSDCNLSSRKMS